ncbi:MAG: PAS domain S-box protein [Armatimonadetes bacterium]|nr:PAS domain S-box protein [Armatimonadota bacterium]
MHPDGVYWMDTANRFIYVNQAACDALGYTRDELLGMPLVAVNAGATPEAMARVWEQLRSVGSYCRESVHRRKDGSLFPVEIMATYVRVDDREYNCGYARDISARRRAEESLRESEERYRALADALPQVVFETDRSGRLTYANRIAFEVFGYSTDELEGGLYAVDMVDPTEQERVSSGIECVLAGSPRSQGSEYLGRRKDGSTFPVAIYSTPLLREGEVMGIRGIIIDMTKARQAEAEHARLRTQLFQAQRAEAVGALAGGIAHDFNNLLAAILMQLEMLPLEHDLTPGMVASVREIRESADRAAALTHQLLTFSRRQPIRRSAFDLNMVIAELR